jgi:hypothetical protein
VEIYAPEANRIEDLQHVMELHHIDVYPEDAAGRVCLGLWVTAYWAPDTVGIGVLWRDGKVIRIWDSNDLKLGKAGMEVAEGKG